MKKTLAHISVPEIPRKPIALRVRIVSGLTLLTLLAGIGLFVSRPAHTAGGPVPVAVTNTVQSRDTEGPARQPFVSTLDLKIADGSSQGSDNSNTSGTQTFLVPMGKRLIVQTVSMYRSGNYGAASTVQIFVNANANGSYAAYPLPVVPNSGSLFSGIAQELTFTADGGTPVVVNNFRNGTVGNETDVVTVAGYLVDVP